MIGLIPIMLLFTQVLLIVTEIFLKGLQGGNAETTGEDNFKTVQLVWACL